MMNNKTKIRTTNVEKIHSKFKGKVCFKVKGQVFEVDKKYAVLDLIGTGSFGMVCSAFNRKVRKKVAIKKIPKLFVDLVDGKRILREIKLLKHFNHKNILEIKDIISIPNYFTYSDVYIVTNLLDTDLHRVIHSNQKISVQHRQFFIYQLLRGLKFIHSAGVIHRDLKPSNILVNKNCSIKICDFGLARSFDPDGKNKMTEYVVTRWYRAPEVLLVSKEYTSSIDVWSVGCILAELINRKPLFPGDNYLEQIKMIIRVLGKQKQEDCVHISQKDCLEFLRCYPNTPGIELKRLVPNACQLELDILKKTLVFNPKKRITVQQLLEHPYFSDLHDEQSEINCPKKFNFEYENQSIDEKQLRKLIFDEMKSFHPTIKENLSLTF